MTRSVRFTKMHGAGNDYIYVDTSVYDIDDPARCARLWSDRHKGIGADGLVLIGRCDDSHDEARFTMRIFNADGSEAMMCGNASRCIGKYLYEKGLTTQTQIGLLTPSGVKTLSLTVAGGHVTSVTVDMMAPTLADIGQFREAPGLPEGVFVSMGNPHYVVFTDDVDLIETDGPLLENHPSFPQRCNIEYARLLPDGSLRTRVWERGSGMTQACGTGACATAVAAALTGRTGRQAVIRMDGGTLNVDWRETDGHVMLSGPAEFVYEGQAEQP